MDQGLATLALTAATIGFGHTLLGPDHYVPFVAMARAREWSTSRTLAITAACGVGHVAGSILLGALGIGLGWALGGVEAFEAFRGDIAAWLLLGFGLVYAAWGVRQAVRNRPHSHWHGHVDGTVHDHTHTHQSKHVHAHEAISAFDKAGSTRPGRARAGFVTPWVLFTIFIFGPCEALVPLLMYPAASGSWLGVAAVVGIFAVTTIATMSAAVWLGLRGLRGLQFGGLQPYSHALAGLALAACGLAIHLGL